jgi:hypothetical protein
MIQKKSRTLTKAIQDKDFLNALKKLNNSSKLSWKCLHQLYPRKVSERYKIFSIALQENIYCSFQHVEMELSVEEITIQISTAVRHWLWIPCYYTLSI